MMTVFYQNLTKRSYNIPQKLGTTTVCTNNGKVFKVCCKLYILL